jgi:hypothetical protein
MKNYKQKMKEMNKSSLRFFSGLLCTFYTIQVILHIALKAGIIFEDQTVLTYINSSTLEEERKYFVDRYNVVLTSHEHLRRHYTCSDGVRARLLLL